VDLEVYDVAGRLVESRALGIQDSGVGEALYDGSRRSHGIYFYRLRISDPETGAPRAALYGRMIMLE
jgi:hypothetical protein